MFGTIITSSRNQIESPSKRNSHRRNRSDIEQNWELLGNGAYGSVFLNPASMEAVKVVRKSCERGIANIERERKILQSISHPYIIKFKQSYQSESSVYLCMEHALGGDLYNVLKDLGSLPERVVKLYTAELSSAIYHLHSKGFVHRDIKPENVLIDIDGHVKLCDFGLCRGGADGLHGLISLCGTPPYIAPEVYECSAFTGGYGSAVDWWALGVLLYEMLVGYLPWKGRLYHELYGQTALYFPNFLSKQVVSLLNALLTAKPSIRIGTWNSRDVLSHNFFSGIDWQALNQKKVPSTFNPYSARVAIDSLKSAFDSPNGEASLSNNSKSCKVHAARNHFHVESLNTSPTSSFGSCTSFCL